MIRKNNIIINIAILLFLLSVTFILSSCNAIEPRIELAEVNEFEILILESFPVQVHVVASGNLPNPCTGIDQIIQSRDENNFKITIKIKYNQEICIPLINPFEETIALDVYGLPAGTYNVNVNGIEDSFILEVDNTYQTI